MNWVELVRVSTLVEAYALRSYLEAHEVDVLIPSEHSNRNVHPLSTTHGSMIQLQVPILQVELARQVVREYNISPVYDSTSAAHLPEELRGENEVIIHDEVGQRALRTAIFGALAVPLVLNLYSVKLLCDIYADPRLRQDSKKSDIQLAVVFNIFGFLIWSAFAYKIYLDWAQHL